MTPGHDGWSGIAFAGFSRWRAAGGDESTQTKQARTKDAECDCLVNDLLPVDIDAQQST
jgi:hypothetical protein